MAEAEVQQVGFAKGDRFVLAGGFIDLPKPGDRVSGENLVVIGWAVGVSAPVDRVEVRHRDVMIARTPVGEARPDVAGGFPGRPWAARSGFRASVPIPAGAGEHELQLRASIGTGARTPLGVIRLKTLGPAVAAPALPVFPPAWDAPPAGFEPIPIAAGSEALASSSDWDPALGPDPRVRFPIPGHMEFGLLKNLVKNRNIIVGDYTYSIDPDCQHDFEKNVLYLAEHVGERLIIGKFCSLARGVKFLMNGANHLLDRFSAFAFATFPGAWSRVTPGLSELPFRGDTVVGNDVWIGYDALIMPGVRIGDGAIVGARAVVARDVPAYTVAVGNPARVVKQRFADEVVRELLEIRWWDWPVAKITRNLERIVGADVNALRSCT